MLTIDDLRLGDQVSWECRVGRSEPKTVVALTRVAGRVVAVHVEGADGVRTVLESTPSRRLAHLV